MEFRLLYEGMLLGSNRTDTRADHKHDIRRSFHHQLRRLWSVNRHLKARAQRTEVVVDGKQPISVPPLDKIADNFKVGEYRCLPLVTTELELACKLEILFLRYDQPGKTLIQSGDIDNRLKTLFDALRRPQTRDEAPGAPAQDENPLYCLLEDDKLITDISVTTDFLLQPDKRANDVFLVVSVKIKPMTLTFANIDFGV